METAPTPTTAFGALGERMLTPAEADQAARVHGGIRDCRDRIARISVMVDELLADDDDENGPC